MGRKYSVEIGEIFGRWTVLGREQKGRHYYSTCICKCGNTKSVRTSSLVAGDSNSCGCLKNEQASERFKTHGNTGHELWYRYYDMLRRCNDPNRQDYEHYGGRGIKVCDRWQGEEGFGNFVLDMGPCPLKQEIERIDNNKGYCPENCKWDTRKQQTRNKRNNPLLKCQGLELTLVEWSEISGVPRSRLYDRINKLGWDVETALKAPIVRPHGKPV